MKRTLFVAVCCVFGLFCEVGYSQWFWFPGYSYGYGGCANGQCNRSCANGQCGVKKANPKTDSATEPEKAVNESLIQDSDVKTAEFVTADIEKPVPTAELTEETDEAVETSTEKTGQEENAVKESEGSDSETGLIVPTPDDVSETAEEPTQKTEQWICPFALRVMELINWHRSQVGLPPLTVDNSLVIGCQQHSRYMASYGFGHAYGIGGMECIAMGVNTPESVVNMWLNSSGHRSIIMSRGTKFGFGSFGTFHTLRVR